MCVYQNFIKYAVNFRMVQNSSHMDKHENDVHLLTHTWGWSSEFKVNGAIT